MLCQKPATLKEANGLMKAHSSSYKSPRAGRDVEIKKEAPYSELFHSWKGRYETIVEKKRMEKQGRGRRTLTTQSDQTTYMQLYLSLFHVWATETFSKGMPPYELFLGPRLERGNPGEPRDQKGFGKTLGQVHNRDDL